MSSDLSAEAEREPATREVLQRPRRHRGDGRASRERHRHRRRQPDAGGGRRAEGEQLVRIPLRLLDEHGVEPERLGLRGARRERRRVEWYVRLTQPWVELAEGQQRLDLHDAGIARDRARRPAP